MASPFSQTRQFSSPLPQSTLRAVSYVQSCAQRHVSLLTPDFQSLSRAGDSIFRDNFDLSSAAYSFTTDAVPLLSSLVSLPAQPGTCNLLDVLPPHLARIYEHENPDLFRPIEEQVRAPAAYLVHSDEDYILLIKRLYALDMVSFTVRPKVVGGCFGSPKSDGSIRFLFDGRRTNAIWVPSPDVELPSPDLLAKLEAPPGEKIFVCKSDLDNFYHRLRLPEWMRPYFALPPVRAGDLGLPGYDPDVLVYPCCTTLPMGWSHSAFLAQASHEHIVSTKTSIRDCDRITRSSDLLLDRPRHFIYIDDFGGICLERHRHILAKMQEEYNRVLAGEKLPPKLSSR
jgi:hypothetical protein